jgi:hypothetical protein
MLANFWSGSFRPFAISAAASLDEESTLTSALKAIPGARSDIARSIASQSAAAPPDAEGSLPPSMTRQCGDWLFGKFMAQALPQKNADVTTKIHAGVTRTIQKLRRSQAAALAASVMKCKRSQ